METVSHAILKRYAVAFLLRIGCCAAAPEVRCPISRFRLDAAGYLDDQPHLPGRGERAAATLFALAPSAPRRRRTPREPSTVIIECKRSRADFFRDGADLDALLARRDALLDRRREIEWTSIRRLEPHLRRGGDSLFPELEEWDFGGSRLPAYRRVLRDLRRVEAQLYGHTKFATLVRYRLADRFFIMAPAGLVRVRELPLGWGLLECPRPMLRRDRAPEPGELDDLPLRLTEPADVHASPPLRRQRLLRNIAATLTASARPRSLPSRAGSA